MEEFPVAGEFSADALKAWRDALSAAEVLLAEGRTVESFQVIEGLVSASFLPTAVLNNAGLLLQRLQRLSEADQVFQRAHAAEPLAEAPLVNRGSLLRSLGRWKECMEVLLRAVQINPNSARGWNNLGMLLKDMKQLPSSLKAFRKAIAIDPDWALAHGNLATVLAECGEVHAVRAALEKAFLLSPDSPSHFSNFLMCLNYLPEDYPGAVMRAHGEFGRRFERTPAGCFDNSKEPERPLRIGFISGDFVDHSVAWFFEPLLQSLKGADLECVCFSNSPATDEVTDRLKKHACGWVDLWTCDDEAAEKLVRASGIDVLIDLSGHTAGNRLPLFARKVAPIQMTMIGYLQTSGLRAMDFRITDGWLDPMQAGEAQGTERLLRLSSGAFGFRIPEGAPNVAPLPPVEEGIVFGSFNSLTKLTPETVRAWADVLKALPTSRLVVVASYAEGLISQLGAHGIAATRISHSQRMPVKDFFNLLGGVHIALDTFPFNGLTVSLLAAWMGVPTVSLSGTTPSSRAGSAVAGRLGLPELAAASSGDYVQTCVRLAEDLETLLRIRGELRGRLLAGFGDSQLHAREFAQAVRTAWRQWCVASSRV